eukprot:8948244-Lingulodinium_polyedra.AAC.1
MLPGSEAEPAREASSEPTPSPPPSGAGTEPRGHRGSPTRRRSVGGGGIARRLSICPPDYLRV